MNPYDSLRAGEATLSLDSFLAGLDVAVDAFAVCEIRAGSSLVLRDDERAGLHYVLSGRGFARTNGNEAPLAPHTLVVSPPKGSLTVRTGEGREPKFPSPDCRSLPGGWDSLTVGDGEAGVVLACGVLIAMHSGGAGLFDHLRQPLVLDVTADASFREPFRRLLDELAAPRPGTRALAGILMKECLISLLRRYSITGEQEVPWLAAVENPQLGKAAEAMMENPERHFSLYQLAEIAGMSRTTFCLQFKNAFNCTPNDFLKDVRIRRGAHLLLTTDLPVKSVAGRVGYSSRSYFSRAFKSVMDVDPATYRMNAQSMDNGQPCAPERVHFA